MKIFQMHTLAPEMTPLLSLFSLSSMIPRAFLTMLLGCHPACSNVVNFLLQLFICSCGTL